MSDIFFDPGKGPYGGNSIVAFGPGAAAETLKRQATEAEGRQRAWAEARLAILKAAKSDDWDTVRDEEIGDFVKLKDLDSNAVVAELRRVQRLEAEYRDGLDPLLAEHSKLRNAGAGDSDPNVQRVQAAIKAHNREWACRDLFGAPRINDTNFLNMPSSGEVWWERPRPGVKKPSKPSDYEMIEGMPRDPRAHHEAGWRRPRLAPAFGERAEALRRALATLGPSDEVEAARDAWRDAVVALSDHRESGRDLIRRANLCPSRYEAELAKFREQSKTLESAIHEATRALQDLGDDPNRGWR